MRGACAPGLQSPFYLPPTLMVWAPLFNHEPRRLKPELLNGFGRRQIGLG
ncbi:hypothetical protein AWB65_03168 [Caballeronia humi]|jgi:hypothetical protein|uniref:Uncharacterized protein n=1 Tax=Caballeronia humi TaxID=326474 RepID=A0A158HCI8_9BURK|nr:hypothetical protein AWB65_03168 [Caballeronia humi]